MWHPTVAGCYLSCNLLTTAWGVAVSTCMGDGGPTWGHAAVMDIGSISGLGAGRGVAIMGTTAYWWYWRDSCCTAANCDINQNNYIGTTNLNTVRCCPALMVTWLYYQSNESSFEDLGMLHHPSPQCCIPGDSNVQQYCCENLWSRITICFSNLEPSWHSSRSYNFDKRLKYKDCTACHLLAVSEITE